METWQETNSNNFAHWVIVDKNNLYSIEGTPHKNLTEGQLKKLQDLTGGLWVVWTNPTKQDEQNAAKEEIE